MQNQVNSMVLLAGGKSSRMGRDKADLILNGKSFLQIQLEKAQHLGIRNIIISGYHGKESDLPYPVVMDRYPQRGPLGGLETCLRELPDGKCLVLSVDVIGVPEKEVQNMIRYAGQSEQSIVILEHNGHQEPLIGIYETTLADEMEWEVIHRKGAVFAFLERVGYDVYVSQTDDRYFTNINTPEHYQELLSTMSGAGRQ